MTCRNAWARCVGLVGILYNSFSCRTVFYPQGFPHRILFVVLQIWWVCLCLKKVESGCKHAKKFLLFGYIIAALGLIWNTDFGLVGIVAYAAFHAYSTLLNCKGKEIRIVSEVIVCALGSFLLAYSSVNIFNCMVLNGEMRTLKQFLFPLGTDIMHAFEYPLKFNFSYWLVILTFLMFVGASTIHVFFRREKSENEKKMLEFFLVVQSLGNLIYFFNRPAYDNVRICCYFGVIILLVAVLEETCISLSENKKENNILKKVYLLYSVYLVIAMFVVGVSNIPALVVQEKGYHDYSGMKSLIESVKNEVPEDAVIWGYEDVLFNSSLGKKKEDILWANSVNYSLPSWEAVTEFIMESKRTIAFINSDESVLYWCMTREEMLNYYQEPYTVDIKYSLNEIESSIKFIIYEPRE